jgi:transcriptional regulator with XRE-family HTH domain
MAARGWSQGDLAMHSGVARSTINRVLHGADLTPSTLVKIGEAFARHSPLAGVLELLLTSE